MTITLIQEEQQQITWEELPPDFQLPNEPVENLTHPLLANCLREILEISDNLTSEILIASNFGICANIDNHIVVKAPDWVLIPKVNEPNKARKSYTPYKEGEIPLIVMEFLSENDNGEYSINPHYPYGKWYFYEHILKVPIYVIFEPDLGRLELYRLISGKYERQLPNEDKRYEILELELCLGIWEGTKSGRTGYWLRWWDHQGNMLPWGKEKIAQTYQLVEQEYQRAERERQEKELALQKIAELQQQLKNLQG